MNKTNFTLHKSPSGKRLILTKQDRENSTKILKASWLFRPEADKTALLSNIVPNDVDAEAMNFMMKCIDNWMLEHKSRLFAFIPGSYLSSLSHTTTRCKHYPDRFIMIQAADNLKSIDLSFVPKTISKTQIIIGNSPVSKELILKECAQISKLMQQTYWGKNYTNGFIASRIEAAAVVVALKNGDDYIGFVRYLNNGTIGFVSDMVIDEKYRQQGCSAFLLKALVELPIYIEAKYNVLTLPLEGVGRDAAPKLYSRFGYKQIVKQEDLKFPPKDAFVYIWDKPNMTPKSKL